MKSIRAHIIAGLTLLLSATLSVASPSLEAQLETAERAQRGIVTFTGAHFQSCAPLLNPNVNPVDAVRSAWGTSASYTRTNRCTDRRNANLNYVSFMNGSIHPNAGQLKSRRGKLNAFARLNCSGFVAGTLAAAGLNYFVDQESRTYSPTTHELRGVFNRNDTCFYKPQLSRSEPLTWRYHQCECRTCRDSSKRWPRSAGLQSYRPPLRLRPYICLRVRLHHCPFFLKRQRVDEWGSHRGSEECLYQYYSKAGEICEKVLQEHVQRWPRRSYR